MVKKKNNGNGGNIYNKHPYANFLEIRMAKLLDANNVEYIPHAEFEVNIFENNGSSKIKTREADFFLPRPIRPRLSRYFIFAIEVKRRLGIRNEIRFFFLWIFKKDLPKSSEI